MSGQSLQVAASDRANVCSEPLLADLLLLGSQMHRLLRRFVASSAGRFGLNETEYLTLRLWGQTGDRASAQRELAADLGISPAQLSGLMERLRQRGFVTPDRCPEDRRRQVWHWTATGAQVVAQIERELLERSAGLASHTAVSQWKRLLQELQRRADTPGATVRLRVCPRNEQAADRPGDLP